jgi:addiction module toxin, RelE/StbE family
VKLEWSLFAVADREQIFDYIEADNPRAAIFLDDRIEARIETLLDYPLAGRSGRIEGTRELVIADTPYIAVYRIANDTIRILRVLHGARQWPDTISQR